MSLRTRLVLLVLALLIPALIASSLLIWDSARQASRMQERQMAATARTLSLVVDRQLSQQTGLLSALSVSYRLRQGDWAGFHAQAVEALRGTDSWIVVRDAAGQQYVNTLRPAGQPLPKVANPRVPPNRPPRPDGIRVSDLAVGAVAGEPVLIAVKSVKLYDGREVDVSIAIRARTLSNLLRRQDLPPSWFATILDGRHRIIARNRQEDTFRGHVVSSTIVPHLTPGASGIIWGKSMDGVPTRAAYDSVANCDWNVIVGVPREELLGPARRAMILGGVVAVALLTVGVVTALRMAHRIARGVGRLQTASSAGVGETFRAPSPSGVREIDELSTAFADAAQRVAAREAQQRLLINELNHRVKNTLATLQSVAKHTRANASTVDQYQKALEGRIMAMSGAHELLTRGAWESADLRELVTSTLRPFEGDRLRIHGPRARVEPTDVLNLALIFYELATNAAKYGALSGADGAVDLSWEILDGDIRLYWLEMGGPRVEVATRKGFGSRLINRAREALHPSSFDYHPEGVRCTLTVRARKARNQDVAA